MRIKKLVNNIVVRNIFYLGIGNGLIQLLGMIAVIVITAIFLPSEYGTYTYMMIQAQLIAAIADLGMRNIIIRDVARAKTNRMRLYFPALVAVVFSNVIIFLFYTIYNHFLGGFTNFQLILIGLYSFVYCVISLTENLLIGLERMLPLSLIGVSFALIWLCFVSFFPTKLISVEFLYLSSLLLLLLKFVALVIELKLKEKQKLFHEIKNPNEILTLVKKSLPFFGLVLVALPINYLSNNFLQINSTMQEIGFFSLAQKLTSPLTMVFGILFSALFPNISILWEENREKFHKVVEKGIMYFILFAAGGAFLFSLLIKPVFHLFFTDEYNASIDVCKTQIWFVCLMGISSLAGTIWGAMNREKLSFKMAAINAMINVPLLWIGSKYGASGLSFSYVLSFLLFTTILWPVFVKTNKINKKRSFIWFPVVIMMVASFLVK